MTEPLAKTRDYKQPDIVPTIYRLCIAHCGVLAHVEDDNGRRLAAGG